MKILVLAGPASRGDVQPVIALGKALSRQGHQVAVAAPDDFRAWIEHHGLEVVNMGLDMKALLLTGAGREWVDRRQNPVTQTLATRKLFNQHALEMMLRGWTPCLDADVIMSNPLTAMFALAVVEKTGAAHISYSLVPALRATRSGSAAFIAPLPHRRSLINYLFGKLVLEPAPWLVLAGVTNRFRREGPRLRPQRYPRYVAAIRDTPMLYAYSPHIVPHPDDWPPHVHTTGFWTLDETKEWQRPSGLQAFLSQGEPPLYVGFGSVAERDPDATMRIVVEALLESRQRAVVLSFGSQARHAELPPEVFPIDYAPFDWLFPKVSAVVQHGGAGTTAACIRAGVPTVIVPYFGDQVFWSQRAWALGVSPRPIPRHKLTAHALAEAIREACSNPRMKRRAEALGAAVRAEDGTGTAAALIEHYMSGGRAGREVSARELVTA